MGPFVNALERLGIKLPPPPRPVAAYAPFVRSQNLLYISGQLPSKDGQVVFQGAVPTALSIEQAAEAAKLCTINAISILQDACEGGDLNKVVRMVKLGVYVQSADGFDGQPKVANGASELLLAVFGEFGKHARSAVGVNALPLNAAVEIDLVVELRPLPAFSSHAPRVAL